MDDAAGREIYGYYPTGIATPGGTIHWIPIQVDADGVLQVSDPPPKNSKKLSTTDKE